MKTKKIKALIIEDSEDDLKLLLRELNKSSYKIIYKSVQDAKGVETALKEDWDVIISDYSLPGFSGPEALKMCNEKGIDIPFITVSGTVGEDIAVDTMKYGAKDYIMKNNLIRLLPAIEREIIDAKIRREKKRTEEELRESEKKYHTIFESTGTAALIVEDDFTISLANTECFLLTGYSSEELVGSKWTNYVEPSCLQEMIKNHNLRSQNPELAPKKYEVKLINKQGEVRNAVLDIGMISETKQRIVSILDITDRKRAEEALRESEDRLSSIYNTAGDVLFYIEVVKKGCYRFNSVNRAFLSITGLNYDQVVGKLVNEVIPEPSLTLALSKYEAAIKEKKIVRWEETTEYPAGKQTGAVSVAPIFDKEGKCTHLVGAVINITERKRTEEALNESEERYRKVVNISPEAIIIHSDGKIVFVNPAALQLVGTSNSDDLLGKSAIKFVHPDERDFVVKRISEIIKSGNSSPWVEERFIKMDGSIIYVETIGTPTTYKGKPAVQVIIRNITERKQAEEELRESEERFRSVAQSANDAIVTSDIKGTISGWNPGAEKMFGYSESEIVGKPLTLIMPQKYSEQHIKNMKRIESSGEKHVIGKTLELKGLNKNGNVFPLELSLSEWETSKGKYHTGIIRDITDRKRAEKEIRRTNIFLDSIVANIPNMIFMKEADELRFVWFNRAGENLMGISKQELLGKNDYDFFPKEQADFSTEKNREVLRSKEMIDIPEEPIQTKHKGIRIVHTMKVPILNDLGEPEYLLGISEDITDRKQAEENTQLLAHTIKSIAEIVTISDLEDKLIFVNQAFIDKYGYTYEEIIGKHVKILHSPNNPPELLKNVLEQSRKDNWKDELLNVTKDGREFPISMQTSKILNENGDIIGLVGIAVDITERKQAEEALRKSEGKYRVLIENMGEGIGITDEEEKFIFVNPAAENIFGVGQGELDGENLSRFFSKEKFKEVKKRTDERRQGKIGSFEEEIILKDGSKKDIFVTASPWYEDNRFKGTFAIFRDITMRKRAEELLKASEEKYRNLIETMPEGFYRSTEEGYFIDVNPALVEMLGYDSNEELMKVYIPEALYFSKEERSEGVNYNIDFIPDSEIYRLKKKDGSEIWVEDSSRYIKDSSGNVLYHEGIMRDVTESLRARNAILEAKEKAEEMSRLKSNFLANMSHEIRTPLNGILGFSDIIKDEIDLEEVKKMSGIINDSGKRLLNSLNQILDLSNLEANTKKVNYKLIDVNYIIKETTVLFSAAAQKKNLVLKSESNMYSLMSYTDPDLISNTLNNLISNAIIYTKRGSVTVRAKEEIINKKECIVINVIDTGIGIEKENLEIIFDEFRQVSEGWGRSFEGTGLGLSLCKKYMNLIGGSISVTSKIGEGSDFRLVIPKNILKDDKDIKIQEKSSVETSERDSRQIKSGIKPKILYIEDDPECIQLVKYILANEYEIDAVTSGAKGIEKTKNNEYALILLDINLSKGISGLEALSEIRKIRYYKDIPVIALTAFAMAGDEEEFRAGGCTDYISKPFKKEMLLEKISKALFI